MRFQLPKGRNIYLTFMKIFISLAAIKGKFVHNFEAERNHNAVESKLLH